MSDLVEGFNAKPLSEKSMKAKGKGYSEIPVDGKDRPDNPVEEENYVENHPYTTEVE